MTAPPVAFWPATVLPDEPVHGFFQRLAEINGQLSCRAFAASVGLNGRNFDFEQLLDFCLTLPVGHVERLADSTPRRTLKTITLGNQKFSPVHFAFSRVRICPACVSESRHHRSWFDLSFIAECPIHSMPLSDGGELEKLAQWYPVIGVLPHSGTDLVKPAPKVEAKTSLARYILGRLGCMSAWPIPFLDQYECCDVIQISETVGRMRQFGWSAKLNVHGKWDEVRRGRTEDGFSVARQGPEAILEALAAYTASSPVTPSAGTISFAIADFFGWLYTVAREFGKTPMGAYFQDLMRSHATSSGVFARKGYQSNLQTTGSETLRSLSRKLGIHHPKARELAAKAGVLRLAKDRGRNHSFSPGACKQIFGVWNDLVDRSDAEAHVQRLELGSLKTLEENMLIEAFIRIGGRTPSYDRFRLSELHKVSVKRSDSVQSLD